MASLDRVDSDVDEDIESENVTLVSLRKPARSSKKPTAKPVKASFKVSIEPVHEVKSYDILIDSSNGRQVVNLTKEQAIALHTALEVFIAR